MLINIIDFSDTFMALLKKYKNKIQSKKYFEDENLNKDLVSQELCELQNELNKQCYYFRYTNIVMDITQKYLNFCNECKIENQKYNDNMNFLAEIKDIVPSIQSNKEALSHLEKRIKNKANFIEKIKFLSFKDFTLEQLEIYKRELEILITNIALYCTQSNDYMFETNHNEKIYGTNNLIAYNYNLISNFQRFSSVIKGVIFKDGQIYTDEAITNSKLKDIKFIQIYEFNNIIELLNLSFINVINQNIHINLCYNCQKFFIPKSRTDEVYCDRISPQNSKKTCKEYGAKKTYRESIKSDLIKNEHNKTSQFYRMRINRAKTEKEKALYQKQFNKYKENYQKKKEQYNSKKLKEETFIQWIKKQKEIN